MANYYSERLLFYVEGETKRSVGEHFISNVEMGGPDFSTGEQLLKRSSAFASVVLK